MPDASTSPSNTPLSVAALLRAADTLIQVQSAFAADTSYLARTSISPTPDLASLGRIHADVILIEADLGNREELRILAAFVAGPGATPLVITSRYFDVGGMRELMQIGILDTVPQPIEARELYAAVRSAASRRRAAMPEDHGTSGIVIAFLKSGGGVGATSIVVQGACAFSKAIPGFNVAVMDLDVQFGNAAFMMDVEPRTSIIDLIQDPSRLDAALLHGAMARTHDLFDLLPAPSIMPPLSDITPEALRAAIELSRREYAVTLLDLPLLWTDWSHAALEASDVVAVVANPAVLSLRQARRQIDVVQWLKLGKPLIPILNRVERGIFRHDRVTQSEAAQALGREVRHVIPNDAAMQTAADSGLPLSKSAGGKPLAKRLAALMNRLIEPHSAGSDLPRK